MGFRSSAFRSAIGIRTCYRSRSSFPPWALLWTASFRPLAVARAGVVVLHAQDVQRVVGHAAPFGQEGQKEVFGAKLLPVELLALFDGLGHDVAKVRRARQSPEDPGLLHLFFDELVDVVAKSICGDAMPREDRRPEAGPLPQEG